MFSSRGDVVKLRKIRERLYRARLYQLANNNDNMSKELSRATAQGYHLLKESGMSDVIASDSNITDFVLDIVVFGHPISTLNNNIALFLGDERHDSLFMSITALLAEIELANGDWTTAVDMFSYALLASIRIYGLEHKSTFKLLHGLGQAFRGQNELRRAEIMFRLAFEGYMRVDRLSPGDVRDVCKVIKDWKRVTVQDSDPMPRVHGHFFRILLPVVLVLILCVRFWPEWCQIQPRLHSTYVAFMCIVNELTALGHYLYHVLASSTAQISLCDPHVPS